MAFAVVEGVNHIHGSLIQCQNIFGSQDTDIRRGYRRSRSPFAVAGHRHVPQHVDKGNVFPEMVNRRLGGFHHAFHKFFLGNAPLRTGVAGMDHLFADASVRHTDGQVFVGAAETAHGMSLKVGQCHQGIILGDVAAHRHFLKIFTAFYRQHHRTLFVQNIHRAEGPAVHLQRLPVPFRRITVSVIVRVGFHNRRARNILFNQFLHPGTGNNIGAVLFAGVQFDGHFACDILVHFFINLLQPFGAQVPGKIYHGFRAAPFIHGNVFGSVGVNLGRCCRFGFRFLFRRRLLFGRSAAAGRNQRRSQYDGKDFFHR